MRGKNITIWFMALALSLIIIYDILAFTRFDVDATISRVVYWWADYSFLFKYMLVAGVNFLMGHLLWGQRVVSKATRELLELIETRPDSEPVHIDYLAWRRKIVEKAEEIKEGK